MKRFVDGYQGEKFDLIVVGGGITGAAVAYDAASRGLQVALLEKKDFGWATSAATSKLIHGGLRYLQTYEIGLVRQSLRERRILENIAPNFVYPIPFLVPGYQDIRRNKWMLRAGLTLYDVLAYDKGRTWDKSKRIPHHRWLSREAILKLEPQVRRKGMTGGSFYYDCQCINPERLTLAFIKSAVKSGAKVANYASVTGFLFPGGKRVAGVKVQDLLRGNNLEIPGSLVVNCGGPWADIIFQLARQGAATHSIRRSEGIHLLTRKLETRHAIVTWTPSGRHLFVVPWRGYQLVGTTDKAYVGNPDDYRVTRQSVLELVKDTNDSIGDGNLAYEDVIFAYGGLRPLVDTDTAGTYQSSRRFEIYDNAADGIEGLITVEGGKYTTSRHLAASVLRIVEGKLGRPPTRARTDQQHLAGCEINDLEAFLRGLKSGQRDFSEATLNYVGRNYGTESQALFELVRQDSGLGEVLNPEGQILASAVHAVRHEMAFTLNDILFRRTGVGNTGHPGREVLERTARTVAGELNWDQARVAHEIDSAEQAYFLPG